MMSIQSPTSSMRAAAPLFSSTIQPVPFAGSSLNSSPSLQQQYIPNLSTSPFGGNQTASPQLVSPVSAQPPFNHTPSPLGMTSPISLGPATPSSIPTYPSTHFGTQAGPTGTSLETMAANMSPFSSTPAGLSPMQTGASSIQMSCQSVQPSSSNPFLQQQPPPGPMNTMYTGNSFQRQPHQSSSPFQPQQPQFFTGQPAMGTGFNNGQQTFTTSQNNPFGNNWTGSQQNAGPFGNTSGTWGT